MKVAISIVEALIGAWLVATPWLFGYSTFANRVIDACFGAIVLVAAVSYYVKNRASKPGDEAFKAAHILVAAIGAVLVVEGIVGLAVLGYTAGAGANEIVAGALLFVLARFAGKLAASKKVVMSGEDGGELVTITKLDYKNGILVMKAKAFGTMPMVVHVEPKQLWLLVGFLSYSVVSHLPGILAKGSRESRESAKENAGGNRAQAVRG